MYICPYIYIYIYIYHIYISYHLSFPPWRYVDDGTFFSCLCFLLLHLFHIPFFPFSTLLMYHYFFHFSSCFTFFTLLVLLLYFNGFISHFFCVNFLHVAFFLCCTFSALHTFHLQLYIAIVFCCSLFIVHFCIVLSLCVFFVLHFFYVVFLYIHMICFQ